MVWYLLYNLWSLLSGIILQIFRVEEKKFEEKVLEKTVEDFETSFEEYIESEEFAVGKAILEKAGYTVSVTKKEGKRNQIINLKLDKEHSNFVSKLDNNIYVHHSPNDVKEALYRHKQLFNVYVDDAKKELENQQ